jgi:hypothetical protein
VRNHSAVVARPAAREAIVKDREPGEEHPSRAEDVSEATAEEEKAPEGHGVGGDRPAREPGREPELTAHDGERDVHHGDVEHEHGLREAERDEGELVASTGCARPGGELRSVRVGHRKSLS